MGYIMRKNSKAIHDIRLFLSTVPNVDGAPFPKDFSNKIALMFAHRLAWKLREKGFVLGDFDHLYIDYNFSVSDGANGFSARSIDKDHPWFRYYEFGVSNIELDSCNLRFFADSIKEILVSEYAQTNINFEEIIENVYQFGENTEIEYKQKSNEDYTAIIYLRILDSGEFLPTVKIKKGERLIKSINLSKSVDLGALGSITISKHKVTIKPKTAIYYKDIPPTIIEL